MRWPGRCAKRFYGPPGTGKTFIAIQLAHHLPSSPEHVELVQLHASYSYEDFIEGLRPNPLATSGILLFAGRLLDRGSVLYAVIADGRYQVDPRDLPAGPLCRPLTWRPQRLRPPRFRMSSTNQS
jgi:hypothetical protein